MSSSHKSLESILTISLGFSVMFLIFKNINLLYIGLVIGGIGLFSPFLREKIVWIWERIGHILGTINGKILLSLIFFFILTPIAFLMRLFSGTSMQLKKQQGDSYYIERNKSYSKEDLEEVF